MEELIQQAMLHIGVIGDHVKAGHFDLLGPDGNVVLPSVWEHSVEPGWFVTMRMWKDAEDAKKKGEEDVKLGKDKAPIRFKDAVGRKFNFPFHLCQTWPVSSEMNLQSTAELNATRAWRN